MFVCLCHGITDSEVKTTVRRGATSVDDVTEKCGAGSGCGMCKEQIQDIIDDEMTHTPLLRSISKACSKRARRVTSDLIQLRGQLGHEG